jgi:hypothetical protein
MRSSLHTSILSVLILILISGCDNGSGLLGDFIPPSWVGTTGITSVTPHDKSVTVTWGDAIDINSPPVTYLVYVDQDDDPWNEAPVEVMFDNEYTVKGLTNGTMYWFGVRCQDSATIPNQDYNNVVLSIAPQFDNEPPEWDGEIGVTDVVFGNQMVTIYWDTATDAVTPPVQYLIYVDTDPDPWNQEPVVFNGLYPYSVNLLENSKPVWVGVRCRDSALYPNVDDNNVVIKSIPCYDGEPSNPTIVGSCSINGEINGIEVHDGFAYVAVSGSGVKIVDVNNPDDMYVCDTIGCGSLKQYMTVQGRYLYVGCGSGGLQVIDTRGKINPILLKTIDTPTESVYAQGDYLYTNYVSPTGQSEGLAVYDIHDPTNPVMTDSIELYYNLTPKTGYYFNDLVVKDSKVYVFGSEANVGYITIMNDILFIDASDPYNLVQESYITFPSYNARDPRFHGDYLYFLIEYKTGETGIQVVDINNPDQHIFYDLCDVEQNFDIYCGNELVLCDNHLQFLKLSNSSAAYEISADPLDMPFSDQVGIDVYGDFAYVAYKWDGIKAVQLW